jgi:hypothetical protein
MFVHNLFAVQAEKIIPAARLIADLGIHLATPPKSPPS